MIFPRDKLFNVGGKHRWEIRPSHYLICCQWTGFTGLEYTVRSQDSLAPYLKVVHNLFTYCLQFIHHLDEGFMI